MTEKFEWQEANRELIAEARRKLGDPPTAEQMLAFTRGQLSESEEERVRELLVAYPELARMYSEPSPEAPVPGDADDVSQDRIAAGWSSLRKHLDDSGSKKETPGRVVFLRYFPTTIAAAIALVFFALFVQAENRARYYAEEGNRPRMLASPQELEPDGNRGPGAATMLRKDGEAYLLKPRLINQVRYPHYQIELRDLRDAVLWTNKTAQPDEDDAFQIVVPHAFLRDGEKYRMLIFGVDGEKLETLGSYDLTVPVE